MNEVFQLLAEWAFAKVTLLRLQKEQNADKIPEAIKNLKRLERIKKKLDAENASVVIEM